MEVTSRYEALGMAPPDPETMCKAECEGTGYVPCKPKKAYKDGDAMFAGPDLSPALMALWDAAEAESPAEDGWHFVKCPGCNGTGKAA